MAVQKPFHLLPVFLSAALLSCDDQTARQMVAPRADLADDTRICVLLYDRGRDHGGDMFEPHRDHSQVHLAIEYTRKELVTARAVQTWLETLHNPDAPSTLRDDAFDKACSHGFGLTLGSSADILKPLFDAKDGRTLLDGYNPAAYRAIVEKTVTRLDGWLAMEAGYRHSRNETPMESRPAPRAF